MLYSHLCIYKYHKFGYFPFVPFSHFRELCFSEETDLFGKNDVLIKATTFCLILFKEPNVSYMASATIYNLCIKQ